MLQYDFVVYGGFDAIVQSLKGIALIFSDQSYYQIFRIMMALGLGGSIIAYFFNGLFSPQKPGFLEWARTFWWAIFFFFFLIAPIGTLHVYDRHKNRYQAIGSLPIGIVLTAGAMNTIETNLVDIVNTAMSPLVSYDVAGDGTSFKMLRDFYSFVKHDLQTPSVYDRMNLNRFTIDCYLYGVAAGVIDKDLHHTSQNLFNDVFSTALFGAIFSVVYSPANPDGVPMSCHDTYLNVLKPSIPVAFADSVNQFCSREGYDTTNAAELVSCKNTLNASLQTIGGFNGTDPTFAMIQMYIAQHIQDLLMRNNPVKIAEFVGKREMATKMAGVGIVANEFIPIFRSVMLALAFAITPLIFLLMATFAVEAFMYYIGLFAFLAVWGVMDAILYNFALNYAMGVFKTVQGGGLALNTIFSLDTAGAITLSVFGYFRVMGAILSSSMVFGIMKFGGDAFARAMGSVQGQVAGAGATAGKTAFTPEGRTSYMKSLEQGIGNMDAYRNSSATSRVASYAQSASKAFSQAATARGLTGQNAVGTGMTLGQGGGISDVTSALTNTGAFQRFQKTTGMSSLPEATRAYVTAAGAEKAAKPAMYKSLAEQAISKEVGAGSPGAVNNLGRVLNKGAEMGGSMGRSYVQGAVTAGGSKSPLWKAAQHYGLINEKGNFNEGADLTGVRGKLNNDVNVKAGDIASDITGLGVIDKKGNLDQTMVQAAKVLGTMPGKDLDGDGKIGDFERGVGLMRLKQMQYSEGSATLDKSAAENLSNKTGFDFKAGDRVKFGYDSETGDVTVAKGESGISKITKEGATTEANYNGEQLKGLAKTERKNGHSNGAKALEDLSSALREGETAKVSISGDGKGSLSTIKAEHGSNVLRIDHSETGRTAKYEGWSGEGSFNGSTVNMTGGVLTTYGHGDKAYSTYKGMIEDGGHSYSGTAEMNSKGNILKLTEDNMRTQKIGDKSTRDFGYSVNSDTMNAFMGQNPSPSLSRVISNDLYDKDGNVNETVAIEQAQKTAGVLDGIEKHSGATNTVANISADGGIHFKAGSPGLVDTLLGVGIDANSNVGLALRRTNQESYTNNLNYGATRRVQEKAGEVATINGKFNPDIAKDYYHEGMAELRQVTDARVKGQTEFDFGASSIAAEPYKAAISEANNFRKMLQGKIKEDAKTGFFDSLKGKSKEETNSIIGERYKDLIKR